MLECVDRDPRWDSDIDERDDYYAQLLLAAGVGAAMVERLVIEHEPAYGEWLDGPALPLDVLIRMAVRGSRDAQSAVRSYLAEGPGGRACSCR